MPNLFRHLIESNSYETLNRVQGDKIVIATQPLDGEGSSYYFHGRAYLPRPRSIISAGPGPVRRSDGPAM
jgi:hypothetical protein